MSSATTTTFTTTTSDSPTIAMSVLSTLSASIPTSAPSWSTLFKSAFILLCAINIKSVPLTWHFRFYRSLFHHFLWRRNIAPAPSHLFSPITTTSRSPLYECDLNGHKSNSTYFSDLDIARTHLVCHLTKRSFALRKQRGEKTMYVALAGVTALFRREIKPFEKYVISSRVLGWDGKWVWVVSHFVSTGKKEGKRRVFASCLSKYVFKSARITVPPEVVFRESGLLPERPAGAEGPVTVESSGVSTPVGLRELGNSDAVRRAEAAVLDDALLHSEEKRNGDAQNGDQERGWSWERIEEERKKGVRLAGFMLGLDGLDEAYREGDEEGLVRIGEFF